MPDIFVSKASAQSPTPSAHSTPGHSPAEGEARPFGRHNPLASFCYLPDNIKFETAESGEKVVLFLRPHIVTNVPWIIIATVLFLAPGVLSSFPLLTFLPGEFQVVAVLAWYLVATAFVLESFLTWFFNIYILTDERVIDIDFHNLIYREISETKIDKIQDVTYKVGGVTRAIFHYGDVYIQTAGTVPNFDFMGVPQPNEVVKIIQELRVQEEQEVIEGRVR
ncbi:PH domain-containing protein [Candidatus Microgenomates bacterium]|nr:PH domain-containing protein [Candidatus Microgenomates bacterium]